MRWKFWSGGNPVNAHRVTVRSHMPWPLRVFAAFILATIAAAAGVAIYEFGRNIAGPDRRELQSEIDRLTSELRETVAERDRNAAQAAALESELKVQKAAQDQLMQQVGSLETELARLQGDLSFFESLLPAGKGDKGVVIRSFRLQPDPETSQVKYRLLVQQNGKPDKDFVGSVQLQVSFMQSQHNFTLQVPDPNGPPEAARALQLGFRHYQRIEGAFTLPPGAVARSVLVRILSGGGEPQLQQTFTP